MSNNFNSSLEDTGSCQKKEMNSVFIEVNAIKFVGRTLTAFPKASSHDFLEPLLNVLFECLDFHTSIYMLAKFSYIEDDILYEPFEQLCQGHLDGIYGSLDGLSDEIASMWQQPKRGLKKTGPFCCSQSSLEFLVYLRQYIKKYVEENEAYAANTDMEQTLAAFARSFGLEPPEVDLLRFLAVIKEMSPTADCFKGYLITPSKKYPVAQRSIEIKRQRKALATLLGSDDQEMDILQEGDMFDLSIFANCE